MGPSVVAEKKKLNFDRDNKSAYQADWEKLYNLSTVDFFNTDKRPTGSEIELGPEKAVKTPGKSEHS